jgi:phage tail sheath gpL-like
VSDALDRLRDVLAVHDERSHVDAAARLRISGLILQVGNEQLNATARRLVAALPADDLAAIVADWLDAQIDERPHDRAEALARQAQLYWR